MTPPSATPAGPAPATADHERPAGPASPATSDREARSAAVMDREARSAAVIDRAAVIVHDPPGALAVPLSSLHRAIAQAQAVLRRVQHQDGAWRVRCDYGPWCTAQVVLALRFAGHLSPEEAAGAAQYLRAQQREDGSFAPWPFARAPEDLGAQVSAATREHLVGLTLCSTATVGAALKALALQEDAEAVQRAAQFTAAHGGAAWLLESLETGQLAESSQLAAVFLAMAGELDLHALPVWPLMAASLPVAERLLDKKISSNLVMMLLQLTLLVRCLRGDFGPGGDRDAFLKGEECRRCLEYLDLFQNPNGSIDDNTWQTTIAVCALRAMGLSDSDRRFKRAVAYLKSQKVTEPDGGMWWNAFGNSVWDTVLAGRALLRSGAGPGDPAVQAAVSWMVGSQLTAPQPAIDAAPGAPRTGGWAFERSNPKMPDCDDSGMALGLLGLALGPASGLPDGPGSPAHLDEPLGAPLAAAARAAAGKGVAWVMGMQNPDGGWAAFQYGLPSHARGALPDGAVPVFSKNPLTLLESVLHLPVRLGDPAASGLTGRVLYGLAQLGFTCASPEVHRALAFLQGQQCEDGAWSGRWQVNYLPATACVLMGLSAVRADLQQQWIQGAIEWLLGHQNPDGGWGEEPESYLEPALAGQGRSSMPPLTALLLTALIHCGRGASPQVAAGIRYLLAQQRPDGTWPNADWLHSNLPPNSFYYFPIAHLTYPLEALGCYLAFVSRAAGGSGEPAPERARHGDSVQWRSAPLDAMRQEGDPVADQVVAQILQEGRAGSVNRLLATMMRSDEPIPPGLPAPAQEYFARTEALPPWADPARIAIAQRLFVRCGWDVAAALFCSSLPQAYAAPKGARVLMATGGMTAHVSARVYETGQFLFDVMDPGALLPLGRGVRTAQKVRLLHAAIRHLVQQPGWDPALGVPINQEDLAGTLMTFSCVIIEALRRLRIEVSADEAEAWQHAWNVVGHLLGAREDLLPPDLAAGEGLMDLIRHRQWGPSPHGRDLAAALVQMLRGLGGHFLLTGLPATMIRYLAGDHCADLLGLPHADWSQLLLRGKAALERALGEDHDARLLRLFRGASHKAMEGVVWVERGGKQTRFRIPESLHHSWGQAD